jgi:ferredoxin/flavodoxin---NADP+ reductase
LEPELQVAVVGAGPAGLYTTDALLRQDTVPVRVDVLDELPTPFGLLRYGVAPDHLKIKSVANVLQRVLDDERVRLFGNVGIDTAVSAAELREHYHAVVYAFGAAGDRLLGVPGEELLGSMSAREFVVWYCGHPEATLPPGLLSVPAAAVIGVGNVAVDVARVLGKRTEDLAHTDMPEDVLDALRASQVNDIYMLGRRGPAAVKFTPKELRELGEIDGLDVVVDPADLVLDPEEEAALPAGHTRMLRTMREWSQRPLTGAPRRLHLRFGVRPTAILGTDRVSGLRVARRDGVEEELPVGIVMRAVGYLGLPIADVPFDADRAVIPTQAGRVLRDGAVSPGEYASGWISRGPTGVIGTNRSDGQATADSLIADAASLLRTEPDRGDLLKLLLDRGRHVVSCTGWRGIDAAEMALGEKDGRARIKIVPHAELLAAAGIVAP